MGNTLSDNGTVARGVCSKNEQGNLTTVVERTEVERRNGEVQYKDEDGNWVTVPDTTPVSMNVWGFTPDYFAHSEPTSKSSFLIPRIWRTKRLSSLFR